MERLETLAAGLAGTLVFGLFVGFLAWKIGAPPLTAIIVVGVAMALVDLVQSLTRDGG